METNTSLSLDARQRAALSAVYAYLLVLSARRKNAADRDSLDSDTPPAASGKRRWRQSIAESESR